MIGVLDIKIQTQSPTFPIPDTYSFLYSPSSFRIQNVPKSIGKWSITEVYVELTTPDGVKKTYNGVQNGCLWICTTEGCSTVGKAENGLVVKANGIDENEQPVVGYVLGVGNYYVIEAGTATDGHSPTRFIHFYTERPLEPVEGDFVAVSNKIEVYNGTTWLSYDLSNFVTKNYVDTQLEGKASTQQVESLNTAITNLSIEVSNKASSDSLSALASRVYAIENDISNLGLSLVTINGEISDIQSQLYGLEETIGGI